MPDDKDISDDDKALFRKMMREVKPLPSSAKRSLTKEPQAFKTQPSKKPIETPVIRHELSNHYHDVVLANTVLSYCNHSIPHLRFQQLKKGQIPTEAYLDLHGLNPDAASDKLCGFIDNALLLEQRCLLIIHGKGGRFGEAPILKNLVNHWLRQLPQVLAFHSALNQHGGTGAVYVLLKRKRNH